MSANSFSALLGSEPLLAAAKKNKAKKKRASASGGGDSSGAAAANGALANGLQGLKLNDTAGMDVREAEVMLEKAAREAKSQSDKARLFRDWCRQVRAFAGHSGALLPACCLSVCNGALSGAANVRRRVTRRSPSGTAMIRLTSSRCAQADLPIAMSCSLCRASAVLMGGGRFPPAGAPAQQSAGDCC